jgi:hypothetical protein
LTSCDCCVTWLDCKNEKCFYTKFVVGPAEKIVIDKAAEFFGLAQI